MNIKAIFPRMKCTFIGSKFQLIRQCSGRPAFNPRSRHTEDFKNGTCLTLSNIGYVSRVKWSNPGKGVAPSPIPRCSCN